MTETDEINNMVIRSINDLQVSIKNVGMRLHKIEGDIAVLKQFAPSKNDLPY